MKPERLEDIRQFYGQASLGYGVPDRKRYCEDVRDLLQLVDDLRSRAELMEIEDKVADKLIP